MADSSDEEYTSGEEELSDDEELAVALAQQKEQEAKEGKRDAIYNADAMHDKLEDIAWTAEQAWEETLAITSSSPVQIENIDDDLERELAFYNQALEAAKGAIGRFEAAGTAWQRPADYYAEMVKSDEHMAKVKEQLLYEQRQIEAMEQRRKEREAKKFGKQVAAERKKERAQEKKKSITEVTKLRKQREKSGFAGDLDVDAELEKMEGRGRKRAAPTGSRFEARQQSKKRQQRDSKFGFGGPKRLKKQNDAGSAADMDGYRPSRFDDGISPKGRGGRGGGGRGRGGGGRGRGSGGGRGRGSGGGRGGGRGGGTGGKPKKPNRPGKQSRRAMRGGGDRGRGGKR